MHNAHLIGGQLSVAMAVKKPLLNYCYRIYSLASTPALTCRDHNRAPKGFRTKIRYVGLGVAAFASTFILTANYVIVLDHLIATQVTA